VLLASSWRPPRGRRARRGLAGLTEVVARQWLGVAGSSPEGGSAATPASSERCEGGRER
jgi:hypothetical protein